MTPKFIQRILAGGVFLLAFQGYSQEYNNFEVRYQNNIKGDLTFISNNILNRDGGTTATEPEDAYDNLSTNTNNNPETGGRQNYNDYKNMQYIDVDGDPSTFSSSTANLVFPNVDCNRIRYAGLYWSATYPSAAANGSYDGINYSANTVPIGNGRQNDFNRVRFRVPGGSYTDITADEVLFDGFTSSDNSVRQNSPYACYADVTALLTPLANPTGDYTVANIRATTGGLTPGGGSTGGWTLVIVYENPTLTGKLITTFDGFARVRDTDRVDIDYNGFNTIPAGPVNADIGAAALEGDFRISGDRLRMSAASNGGFTTLSNATNPANNFFNSNITLNGAFTTNRTPNSRNTLGFDTDIFRLNNPANSVIPNGETAAVFRFQTNGDQYYPFFNSFNIEIIEPEVVLEKKVEDIAGNDITGQGVNLGQILDYVLSFKNIGNDDATGIKTNNPDHMPGDNPLYTIKDILPTNVTLDETNLTLPPGVTYSYDPATRTVLFFVPDNLVEVGDPVSQIRMRVQVASNCFDFVDACTDLIENLAYSTYAGVINDNKITDDPSVSDFDDCGFVTPGATNFLLDDLSDCNFTRTVQLCGDSVVLDAGDNFDSYVWVRDDNDNGQIDGSDPVLNDGDPDNDPSTLVVDDTGTYIVDKIIPDPCKGFKEIIIVERFGNTQTNPLVDFFNDRNSDADPTNDIQGEIVTCSEDGDLLPKIFLCGTNDTQPIQINITDAQSLSWEKLDEGSCTAAADDCANKNLGCTWNPVATGNNYTADTAGKFRLVVNYTNGCFSRYYFDVFRNNLDILYNKRDIICTTEGNITITNLGSGYGYRLVDVANGTIPVPFSANNGPSFDIATNGAYRVDITQLDGSGNPIPDACIFSMPDIGILNRNFQVDVLTTPANCNAQGTIKIDVLNVQPDYTYVLRRSDGTLIDDETAQPDNTHTFNVNPGDYTIEVTTDDGCSFAQDVTVARTLDPTVTALTTRDIGCTAGTIELTGSNGFPNPDYSYAIWSRNGTNLYADVASVPGDAYDTNPVFTFGWRDTDADDVDEYFSGEDGTYSFVIVDSNNCFAFSNVVTISDNGAMALSPSHTDITCNGSTANLTIGTSGGVAPFMYSIDDGTNYQTTDTFVNLPAGSYDLRVTDASGCDLQQTYSISEPDAVTAEAVLTQDYSCNALGEISVGSVTPTAGGSGSYQYSLGGGTWTAATSGGTVFTGLTDGTYSVRVRDANAITCSIVLPDITIDPLPTTPSPTYSIAYNCDGSGNINVLPNDATFTYSLNGGTPQGSNLFNDILAGNHTVTIDYGSDCTIDVPVVVQSGQAFAVNITGSTNVSCNGQNDGSITFEATNFAAAGFEYSVDGGATYTPSTTSPVTTAANLGPGTQTVQVRKVDDPACSLTLTRTITEPTAVVANAGITTPFTCNNTGATITASAADGVSPYQYRLEDISGGIVRAYQTPTSFTNVPAGNYIVRARDNNGCEDEIDTPISVVAPASFTYTVSATTCYSGANDASVAVNVTGGNGGLVFSINGNPYETPSPTSSNSYVFDNLGSGSYTIDVRDQYGCTAAQQNITIAPQVTVTATAQPIPECQNTTEVTMAASGGDSNFVYALVADGATPANSDFTGSNTRTVSSVGDYDVYTRDKNGAAGYCEASYDLNVTKDAPLALNVSNTPVQCSGSSQSTITVDVTGGSAPYRYSIDDGATYQTTNTFPNLPAGSYDIRVRDSNTCEQAQIYTISEPFTLSASALVAELIECNPIAGAEVRIVNARGGTAPYEYSFDGGATYQSSSISNLFPGDHTVFVRDANNCSLAMDLTVLPEQVPPGVTTGLEYFCDGDATITVTPDDPQYTYTYEIDNVLNTPADSNVFTDVAPGNHVVTVNYVITTVIPPSTLMTEDFGFGTNTPITEIDPVYCYEPQNGTESCPAFGTNPRLQDGEYVVTNRLTNIYGTWISPNDHTGNTDGRYLAINVGGVAGVGGIVYAKRNIEVLPDQDISISLYAMNLLRQGTSGGDPSFEIQLVGPGGNVIASTTTGFVPKNNGPDDWRQYSVDLNPGGNPNLDIVIRTNSAVINGNDLAIDDLLATQPPAKCPAEVSVDVLVEDGKALEANITATTNISCNGASDGAVTFEVENFDVTTGYEYSFDGGATFSGPLTTSPVTINGLVAGTTDIIVRDVADNTCSVTISPVLTEPNTLTATAAVTSEATCLNDATIRATPTGGTPTYMYQLEDTATPTPSILTAYQGSHSFMGVTPGDYVIRVRDANGCETTAPVTVDAPTSLAFNATETACYSGSTDGEIAVNVTDGNGTYQFNINGGPWLSPSPTSAITYTFTGLGAGSYDVNVKDVYGCEGTVQSLVIEPNLSVTASADPITTCASATDVDITATGGDSNYVYAFVTDGTTPVAGDFAATNPVSATGTGDYDVYVRDNGGVAPFCEASFDITILQDDPIAITPTVTDVLCNGDSSGAIALAVTGGEAPYQYQLENTIPTVLTPYQNGNTFSNLPAGNDYVVRVRDVNGCDTIVAVTIAEPDPIVAEAEITRDYTCTDKGEITVGSVTATTGGSGDYQYRINGGAWSASTTGGTVFPDLEDDSYTIEVRDANAINCVVTVPTTIIIDPLPTEPDVTTSVTYNCDGSGNITVLPNDSSYRYSIDAGPEQTGNVFNNIAVGTHTITVDYGKECTVDTTIIVETGQELRASVTASTNVSCNGGADGTITFAVTNFDTVNGFEYSIDGGTTFTGPETSSPITITGLASGAVDVQVRDVLDNTCSISLSRTITEPTDLVTSASITSPYTCDTPSATITANATGGTATYEYQLEDTGGTIIASYQTSATFTNVAVGDYIVRGRDANGCTDPVDAPINVVAPANPTFTAIPTNCYSGNNDATIQVDVLSGNSNYQFNLNGGPWLTPTPATALTYTFQNLSSGTYAINVKDRFGCIGTPQNITINPQLTANAVVDPDLTCTAPASVTINANGGSGSYFYEWSDDSGTTYANSGFTGNVFETSADGAYIFRITDTSTPSTCTVTTAPVTVTPADIPVVTSVTPTDILCNGDNTGTLEVTIDTGIGRPAFTIEVIETNTSTNYGPQTSGLPAGDYEVRITDDKGCVSVPFVVSISQPDAIVYDVDLVPITCNPSSGTDPGSITVENLTGGTTEFTYHLTGNNGYSDSYVTTSGGEDHTFAILEFGIYEVDVVDANGCSVRTTNIIASPPDDLDIDVSTATVDCTTGGTAEVTVLSAVGSGNYEFATLETYSSPYSTSYQPADTAGGDTATFTGLTPGITYTFVVHDLTTDCYYFETAAAPINSPSNMTATLDAVANVTCTGAADGNVSFSFDNYDSGATDVTYEIFNAQSNVTTGFSGSATVNPPAPATGVSVPNFATLAPGVYYILYSEVGGPFNGCSIGSPNFTISESSNLLTVTATSPKNDNCNVDAGRINAQAQHGTAPYEFQYLLDTAPAPTAASAGWATNSFADVESGDYIVYVKDANDCIQTDAVSVGLDPTPDISLSIVDECVNEGTFEVLVTLDAAGLSPYQISVNGATFQNMAFDGSNQYTVSGLSSGIGQTIAVRDLNGCLETETFDIYPSLQFTIQQTELLDCEPGTAAYAEITITVTSGSGNYEYAIDGPGTVDQARTALPSNPYIWPNASAAGPYSVSVYDINTTPPNCVKTIFIDVPNEVVPEFSETHTDVTCNGGANGSITLQETNNGINPLTYTLTPMPTGAVLNGNTFENLPPDTYAVRGTGTNDCFTDIFDIVIAEPSLINVPTPTVVEFRCASGNSPENARITVTGASGGSGTFVRYEFINDDNPATAALGDPITVQSGSDNSYTETNTVGGNYTINVYDEKGCVGTTTATVAPYVAFSAPTATITRDVTCVPGDDAEVTLGVTLDPVTGTPDLLFSVNGTDNAYSVPNQASDTFTGLGVGNYIGRITNNDTGCFVETAFEIEDPNTFEITADTVDVVCFGDDGSVSFIINDPVNGYSGGFTWQIYNSQGTADLTDDTIIPSATGASANVGPTAPFAIGAGAYRVDITQDSDPNCTATDFFNITGPNAALGGTPTKTDVTCNLNDGMVEIINAQGGWGGITYYVDVATNPAPTDATGFSASPRFENLSGGVAGTDYQVWIADSRGCLERLSDVNLIDPTPINANLQVNVPNCSNTEGVLEVTGTTGGQGGNYSYRLQRFHGSAFVNLRSPQNTTLFSNLGEGRYQVVVSDQWDCAFTTAEQQLFDEIKPVVTVDKAIDCDAASPGGAVTVTQTGGSGNFNYDVTFPDGSTPQPTNTTGVFTDLTDVGTYTFTITDQTANHSCFKTITQELFPRVEPIIQIDAFENVTCIGDNDGTISVSAQDNGLTPYTFEITAATGGSLTLPYAPSSTTDLSAVFTGLEGSATGITYTITATGDNSCTTTTLQVITQPDAIVVDTPTVVEFGCASGNNPNNASIEITGANGGSNTFVRYEFINNDDPDTATPGDAITVQSGPNATFIETDVRGGMYTINVYDDNGCVGTQSATIAPYDELLTATTAITNDISCNPGNDGEITVGVTSTNNDASRFEYSIDNGTTYQTSNVFPNLGIGTHVFLVRHVDTGCIISASETISDPNTFTIDIDKISDVVCFGTATGEITLELVDATYGGGFDWEIFNTNGTAANTADDTSMGTGTEATNGPTTGINLPAGSYYVRVAQNSAPTCTKTEAFTISGPTAAVTGDTTKTEVTCNLNDGTIEIVDVLGGWGDYTYFVTEATNPVPTDASGFQNSPLFTNLTGGVAGTDYQIWVADSEGCLERLSDVNLIDPTAISANLQVNVENCTNLEGEIEVISVTGGQGSGYSYLLQRFNTGTSTFDNLRAVQTSPVFSGLGAGRYQVIVSDQWDCSNPTTTPIELYEEIAPTATVMKTIDCTVDPGGQITISQSGGSGTFTYTVTFPDGSTPQPSNTTGVFTNLTQVGEYTFTVTDDRNCSKTIRRALQPQVDPVVQINSFTDVTCFGDANGTISVSVLDNGFGPYTFEITDKDGSAVSIAPTSSTNLTAEFTGLDVTTSANGYTITARSTVNECIATITRTISQPAAAMNVPSPNPVAFGCTTGNVTDYPTIDIVGVTGGSGVYVRYEFIKDDDPSTAMVGDPITVQDGSNSSFTETDLAGGSYTINVYDSNGCMDFTTATIDPFVGISDPVITVNNNVTCNTFDEDITVTVTVDPATAIPNLEYVVSGTNVTYNQTNTTGVFTGLGVGNYTVSIENLDTGCILNTTHSVADPDIIEVTATKLTDEECLNNGVDDGSFEITIANYVGDYSYQVFDDTDTPITGAQFSGTGNTGTALAPFINLPGGVYYVRITETEAPFCIDDSNEITILAPSAAITAVIQEEPNAFSVTCSNDQGRLLVDPEGGEAPYTITIDSGTQNFTETNVDAFIFSGLSSGSFHVTITDAFGCVLSDNIDLELPDGIVANIGTTALTCYDGATASVAATVNARNVTTPVYRYRLNRYDGLAGSNLLQTSVAQSSATFQNLAAGFYSIAVSDDVSCSVETDIVEIVNPTEVEAQLIRTSPLTCTTGVEFELSATGGSGTYEYSTDDATWTPMAGNSVNLPLSGMLDAGVYRYYVRDAANGCVAVQSNSIEEDVIEPLTLTVDRSAAVINCNGDNTAVIYAEATGGLGEYMFELYRNSVSPANLIAGPQVDGEFGGLPMGTYYVNVTSDDCIAPAEEVIITEPEALSLVNPNDFTNVSCNGADDGTITVELTGGVGPYQYAISPNLNQFDGENTFDNLAPGTYRVIAQDQNGCFIEAQYTIEEPVVLEVSATALPEVCEGEENGSIELTINGGTAPYSTRLSDETDFIQDRTILQDLASGSYIIFVRDANGCEENVSITVDPGVNLGASVEPVYGCEGNIPNNYINIVLDDASITDEVLYALDSTDPADMQLNPFFRDIAPGSHYIAISHANGCIVTHSFDIEGYEPLMITVEQSNINELTATVTGGKEAYTIYFGDDNNGSDNTYMINRSDTYIVTVIDENGCEASAGIYIEFIDLEIPNFFTPNGDAENQTWKPRNTEGFPEILTIIFDRYGREVYRMTANSPGWDGFYQQNELPSGDYWYIIKLRGENDDREFVGHFTLYR